MRRRFKDREAVEEFLVKQFPNVPSESVIGAFSWAFFDGDYQPTDAKRAWVRTHRSTKNEAVELEANCENEEAEEKRWEVEMSEIWHKHYPKTGGQDPADYILADWVKMGFEDLGLPVTFGISGVVQDAPSTAFGRLVKAALNWRGSATHWRRPAEAAAKNTGPLV